MEDYFLALLFFGESIPLEISKMLRDTDFERESARRLWKELHDIIKNSKIRNIGKLLKKLPKAFTGYIDELYLVNINPELDDKELWGGETVKIAKMLKKASLKRQLNEISGKLKEAQNANGEKTEVLFVKFKKISSEIKGIG
jgi:replicative DNA helicase